MLGGLSQASLVLGVVGGLWLLSVSSWVVIAYKTWWMWRASRDVVLAQQAFWQSADPHQACQALTLLDRHAVLLPLARQAYPQEESLSLGIIPAWVGENGHQSRVLQSLRQVRQQVQWGQPWLACVAATAPFVGLLGTVWGLLDVVAGFSLADEGALTQWLPALSQTLHLTAAGLVVAVPALLAHHLMAPRLNALQQAIDDFAADLIEQLAVRPHG